MVQKTKPIEILLVEDNPGDARLTVEALKESKLLNNLHHVGDGQQAIAFLKQQAPHQNAPRPDIILLDLNLPKKSGHEVLSEVKADPNLKAIPVVVLTSSEAERDIVMTYKLHANCYITKPVDLDKFISIIQKIEQFWMTIVKLPAVDSAA
jgi:chemotaxis family two-component system response regulator Rcp1